MLKSLLINNIAVIENAEPVFSSGFNVLTGETGAGKSIIVDSINAILGERTSKEIIRNGCDKSTVVAVFEDVSDYCKSIFDTYDIEPDNGQYIFQRSLNLSGKNNCRVNGVPVNTAVLKDIGRNLINIHGQHDNQLLLNAENHLIYLDAFAENSELLADYKYSFQRFKEVRKELKQSIDFLEKQEERIDILNYQINELESANITVGEAENLKSRIKLLENSERICASLSRVSGLLTDSDDSSFFGDLSGASSALSKLSEINKEVAPICERLGSAVIELDAIREDTQSLLESLNFSADELENSQNRLDFLYTLMRKYGNSEEDMLLFLKSAKSHLESIQINSDNKQRFEEELVSIQNELISKASVLSKSRTAASKKLSGGICNVLKFLDMENVRFSVNITEGSYTSTGTDRVEFFISTNSGQQLMPLGKIASGGELSRIMLAIKSVLADKDNVDTLIFDEIDTGISGRAARKIAIQLKRVSALRQVICITHLAQIAAIADNHLLINKKTENGKTSTSVETLIGDSRIAEVARIMSGSEITQNLYNTAKELIESEQAEQ